MSNKPQRPAFPRQSPLPLVRQLGKRLRGGQRVVILAPHPDDETIGCGRLIAALARRRVPLAVVALTDGQASHPGSRRFPPAALAKLRRAELRRALARLGAARAAVRFAGWRDGALAADGDSLRLRALLRALRAGAVLAASPRDHHPDHQAGWALARAATRGGRAPLAAYAVWSRLDDGVRDIAPHGAAKRWALAAHRSQLGGLIDDAPGGFALTPAQARRFARDAERFERATKPSTGR